MFLEDNLKNLEKKKKYSLEEISQLLKIEISTIRTWRDLGVFNKDKSNAFRLKTLSNKNLVLGKNLIEFLKETDDKSTSSKTD